MVFLKLQPYSQNSLVAREVPKLAAKYFGPYKVLDKIGNCAYKLELPTTTTIHPIFHVSQLKAAVFDQLDASTLLPSALPTSWLRPLAILDRRTVKRGNRAVTQWLIHWNNSALEDATWEFTEELQLRFPNFP